MIESSTHEPRELEDHPFPDLLGAWGHNLDVEESGFKMPDSLNSLFCLFERLKSEP